MAVKSHLLKKANGIVRWYIKFCFPPGEWHPASTGRLAVFGNYGPLADDGNLRCGIRGDHIVSDVELKR